MGRDQNGNGGSKGATVEEHEAHLTILLPDPSLLPDVQYGHFASPKDFLHLPPGLYHKIPRTTIPHRQPRPVELYGLTCPRTPSTRLLCQLLATAIVLLVLMQALSCGLFFCVALPIGRAAHYIDLRDLFTEFTIFHQPSTVTNQQPAEGSTPLLIPRIVHQTYSSKSIPDPMRAVMQSWQALNGGSWQFRFYDDAACIEFVRREFPEYLDAYQHLPKDVERSDFFRYMVTLKSGGVYADIDVECRQPLDQLMRPDDTLVVGWESEVATDAEAFKRHFVRKRQVLQWFFAAAPGHPVLRAICDHIASNVYTQFSNNTNRDTLERTGPGAWTDFVLRHAAQHPAGLPNDPWKVRILPRVAFGVHPAGIDGLTPDAKEIVVLHHFMGSWKKKGGWHKRRTILQIVYEAVRSAMNKRGTATAAEEPIKASPMKHYPVSVAFEPPFVMMTDLIGSGDTQSGSDISAAITSWGTWQAALSPSRNPSVVEALVGSLGPKALGLGLVDISAGQGFFSLAAASRGHNVAAFETSPASLDAFTSSIIYNGFQQQVKLYNVSLGAQAGQLCLRRKGELGALDSADVAMRRGYGDPVAHAAGAADCEVFAARQTLSNMLGNDTSVGALRLSTHGWEGWVLDGAEDYLRMHTPGVVLMEFAPTLIRRSGYANPTAVLQKLYALGYVNIAHAGYVCDERWNNITRALRTGEAASIDGVPTEVPRQPTWCKLKPDGFETITQRAHEEVPENILFIHNNHHSIAATGAPAPSAGTGAGAGIMGPAPAPAAAATATTTAAAATATTATTSTAESVMGTAPTPAAQSPAAVISQASSAPQGQAPAVAATENADAASITAAAGPRVRISISASTAPADSPHADTAAVVNHASQGVAAAAQLAEHSKRTGVTDQAAPRKAGAGRRKAAVNVHALPEADQLPGYHTDVLNRIQQYVQLQTAVAS